MGKVVADGIVQHSGRLADHVSWFDPTTQLQAADIAKHGLAPAGVFARRVATEAMVLSFNDGFRMTTAALGLGIIMVLLLKKPAPGPAPAGAH